MASFGELLRELRVSRGLTQEDLAEAASLSTRAVSDLERGINLHPRKDTANLLAEALGLAGDERTGFEQAARGRVALPGVAGATRTLPRDIASFTGREAELEAVARAAKSGEPVSVCVIGGLAGVGKTALAVHAAHQLTSLLPDGQLFLSFHAHTPGQQTVEPLDALASLLQTIGVAAHQIPPDLDARAGLWRDRLSGKRLLLVLDDVPDSEQIRPLLPAGPGSFVLVTSRRHLTALEDASYIDLNALPRTQAAELLVRLAARPELNAGDSAVAHIVELCGCLPLALGMVARQLHHHPSWTAAGLAEDLALARDRPLVMRAEDLSVAAAFDLSYRDLTADEQRMFRRLGVHPGADIDAYAAAALDDAGVATAKRTLEGLYDHYLLSEPTPGRYRLHDLLREHARALAEGDGDAAVGRLLDYYTHTAQVADQQFSRRGKSAMVGQPAHVPDLVTRHDAAEWMQTERLNLHAAAEHAAASGQAGHTAALAAAMSEYLRSHGHWDQALTLHRAAHEAAHEAGLRPAEARALIDLGEMQYLTDDYPAAAASLTRALEIYREIGDRSGEASALSDLGTVHHLTGDYLMAASCQEQALSLYRDLGDRPGEANVMSDLGTVRQATGDYAAAAASLTRALEIYREIGDRSGEASALSDLGTVHHLTGDYLMAASCQEQALSLYRDLGDQPGEANVMSDLGTVRQATGDYAAAAASLTRALEIYREIGDRSGETEALNNMGELGLSSGLVSEANAHYHQALAIATAIAAPREEARALEGIGRCEIRNGAPDQAVLLLRQALEIYRRIGSPRAVQIQAILQ